MDWLQASEDEEDLFALEEHDLGLESVRWYDPDIVIDDSIWDEPEKPYEGYDCDWFLEEKDDIPPLEEINHLTRSGRHYQPEFLVGKPSGEKAPEKDKGKKNGRDQKGR